MRFSLQSLISDLYEFTMVFLILASVWIFFAQRMQDRSDTRSPQEQSQKKSQSSKNTQSKTTDRINEHIKVAHLEMRLQETSAYLQNEMTLSESQQALAVAHPEPETQNQWGLKIEQEDHFDRIEKELDGKKKDIPLRNRPDDRINARLASKQFQNEYDKAYEKAYINSFKKNAADAGYQVELNENLDIVRMRQINKPQPMLFE